MGSPEYPNQQTTQALAEHLAAQSGKTVIEEWEHALRILDTAYEQDVLALDEEGKVVNLGRLEDA